MADNLQGMRSYEISVWTLQDECITVLKPSELEFKGEVQNGSATFADDGTEELTFSIPMYYFNGTDFVLNPAWSHILNGHFTANMHKVKLIFNKATEDEKVFEMLITNVTQSHERDEVKYDITCEGLAFHELGKLGYKISLSSTTFEEEYGQWFKDGQLGEAPHATIQYWNDKIFKYSDGTLKYAWDYEVNMDWSGYSNGVARDPHKVYEEEYVSSWNVDPFEYTFSPSNVEGFKEKWRQMDEEESNIYNLTQAIAEKFGVFCRYEYEHDVNYHITGRKVIYYNNALKEQDGYADLTYPYSAARIERNIDNTDTVTKLFVRPIESDSSSSNLITITTVDGNPSKEDYLLNFDYLHEIHTITDEQYEQVHIYEGKLREINEQAVELETQIMLVQEELVKVRADYATYTSAIKLDTERLNNARLLYQQLTGELEYVEITAANPAILPLYKISDTSNGYYVKMPNEGIFPESVNLYTTINYARHQDDGRLTGLITSGELVFDEFNNLSKITNIYITNDEQTRIYMTYNYSPKLYYEKVQKTWEQRLASDTTNQALTEIDIQSLELMLYSADTDYAHCDYATADAGSVQTCTAIKILRNLLDVYAIEYNVYKLDFNNRIQDLGTRSVGISLKHRNGETTIVQERYMTTHECVCGNNGSTYVIVYPILPTGEILQVYDSSVGKYVYTPAIELAQQYANGSITLDTTIGINCTFADIFIASVGSADVAEKIIDAIKDYDDANVTTTCAFIGNATVDYQYADCGYTDKALTEEAHGYCALYDFLLEKKYEIITNFEKWMGPALREGYWQADDYNDYGNKYSDKFYIKETTRSGYDGSLQPDLINFTWDRTNIFTGETDSYYELTVNQNKEYYLMVDLRPYLNKLYNYTENLCFIYYNKAFLDLNETIRAERQRYDELQELSGLTHEELQKIIRYEIYGGTNQDEILALRARINKEQFSEDDFIEYKNCYRRKDQWDEAIVRNEESARHWFVIDSQCEFGYVWCEDKSKGVTGYIPVLILTGIKDLTTEEKLSIVTPYEGFEPFLGTVETSVIIEKDEAGKSYSYVKADVQRITPEGEQLKYINVSGDTSPHESIGETIRDEHGNETIITKEIKHTINYINTGWIEKEKRPDATIVYPRLRINSLELKNNSADVLISLNGYTLTYIEDFYVLVKLDKVDNTHKYFITIKPKMFIKYAWDDIPRISINYTTSNASEAIYLDAIKVMKENAYPKVSYSVDLNVLNPAMIRTAYEKLRTIVHINDFELQLDKTTGYISKIILDLDQPQNDKVEIKNYETKFEDLFSTIVAQSENMKKNENTISIAAAAFSPGGTIYTSVLQESLLKADLNYSFNQGKLTIDEDNGIWGTSDSGVVAFRGGGIFTASTRGPNGEWEWNTGILPTGINADLITTGQLDTNKIRIYAGNKVAFQMNGEGIFAYKTFANDQNILGMTEEQARVYKNNNEDLDALQYVTYNENGLFLTAKAGTMVLNEDKTDYVALTRNVNRVEISWDGLKLRNWAGDSTFYADPNTGNLTLKGTIETAEGHIGSWNINSTGLEGEYIKFINDKNDLRNNGIFLTNKSSAAQKTITYQDTKYYAYKINGAEDSKIYYIATFESEGYHVVTTGEQILTYDQIPVACRPMYVETATEEVKYAIGRDANGNDQYAYFYPTRMYIADSNHNIVEYGGEKIIYDGSDSLTSSWYTTLSRTGRVLTDYVIYTYVSELTKVNLETGTLLQMDTYNPTFSVFARTGEVIMNVGQLGLFSLENNYITGNNMAQLRQTELNSCYLENSTIDGYDTNYGSLVTNIWGNSTTGTINFSRVNGDTINFNVADMYYYQHNISAAQVIETLTGTTTDATTESYVTIVAQTAKSNIGTQYTRTGKYLVGDVWSKGWNAPEIDTITRNWDSGNQISVRATSQNGKYKDVTLTAPNVYDAGKKAGTDSVSVQSWTLAAQSYSGGNLQTYTKKITVKLTNEKTADLTVSVFATDAYEAGKTKGAEEANSKYSAYSGTLYTESNGSYSKYDGTLYTKSD